MLNAPLRRLITHLRREVWQRRLPHGLLSLRYLWPGTDARIRAHRLLWWHAGARWPRSLWLLLQLVLYLRWVFISGPWLSLKVWRRWRADEPARTPPISLLTLLRLTLGWCIPPHACRQFDLLAHPEQVLDYVYDHELQAYHAVRSAPLPGTREQAKCLQDKVALTEDLAELGLPMTPILQQIRRDAPAMPFVEVLPAPVPVFCKTRSGNQGRDAFAAWPTAEGWAGKAFTGQALMVVSDDHSGLRAARRAVLGGATWQRCQFHLARNAIHHAPNAEIRKRIGKQLKSIWTADDLPKAETALAELVASYRTSAPNLAAWLECCARGPRGRGTAASRPGSAWRSARRRRVPRSTCPSRARSPRPRGCGSRRLRAQPRGR